MTVIKDDIHKANIKIKHTQKSPSALRKRDLTKQYRKGHDYSDGIEIEGA
jgi:hypothetical protein